MVQDRMSYSEMSYTWAHGSNLQLQLQLEQIIYPHCDSFDNDTTLVLASLFCVRSYWPFIILCQAQVLCLLLSSNNRQKLCQVAVNPLICFILVFVELFRICVSNH